MLDISIITILIDLAVAVGTLALAILTVHQLRLLVRERKASQARELADRIYTPLRKEVTLWSDPEEVYGGVSSSVWKHLNETAPYLTQRVPRDLASILDKVQSLFFRVDFLTIQVRRIIIDESNRLGRSLRDKAGEHDQTMLRIVGKRDLIVNLDLGKVWSTKMTLIDWSKNYVSNHYPVSDWEIDVQVGNNRAGGTKEAERLADQLFKFLKSQSMACELLEKIEEITKLAHNIVARIDQELSQPVAPWV
jgi:hypothetical protein